MVDHITLNKRNSIVDNALKRVKKKRYNCFFPRCLKKAINSHSQSASSSLRSIQENGFVIARKCHFLPRKQSPNWEEVGVNKVTTFKGFCHIHDNKLFERVDLISDKKLSSKTLAHLAFRTFAMETRKKEYYADFFDEILSCDNSLLDPIGVESLYGLSSGFKNCLNVSKPCYINFFDKLLKKGQDVPMVHKVNKFDVNIGISCATLINPVPTFQQPLNKPQPMITLNVLPRQGYTLIITSCREKDYTLMKDFIRENERIEDLIFNYCEEVVMNVSLFNRFDQTLIATINEAQLSWDTWEHKRIPDIFNVKIDDNSLLTELKGPPASGRWDKH